jgi:hypothetical protein
VLESVDPQVAGKPVLVQGNGLPPTEADRRAGTHSGFATTLRFAEANDEFLPGGSGLFQYEATFRLNALTHAGQTVLQKGQITARGVKLLDAAFKPILGPGELITMRSPTAQAPTPTLADRSPRPPRSASSSTSCCRTR